MRTSLSAYFAQKSAAMAAPSPFSFLKAKEAVNLDKEFPDSRKSYAYEIGEDISNLMEAKGITYATITTASKDGPTERSIVHLPTLKNEHPDLENIPENHPEISQELSKGYFILNPRYLTA